MLPCDLSIPPVDLELIDSVSVRITYTSTDNDSRAGIGFVGMLEDPGIRVEVDQVSYLKRIFIHLNPCRVSRFS
jgi:hypothetical protein